MNARTDTKQLLVRAILQARASEPRATCPETYSDEYIAHWGAVYEMNPRIRERGVNFVTFLAYPGEILAAMSAQAPEISESLHPRQREVQRRIDTEAGFSARIDAEIALLERLIGERHMRVSNGSAVEPLHHRVWPRHADKRAPLLIGAGQ